MAFDVASFFNSEVPALIMDNAADVSTIGAIYQLVVPGAGEWLIDAASANPSCVPGRGKADCTVTLSAADLEWLVTGSKGGDAASLLKSVRSRGFQLFFAGRFKVKGRGMLAIHLERYFTYAAKKAAGPGK